MIKHLFLMLSFFLVSCSSQNPICSSKNVLAEINSVQFNLEVACTDKEKETGLMYRNSLGRDHGMIFIYDTEEYYAFWMKNTNIPLSIAFINKDNIIVDIKHMQPHDLTPVPTSIKAIYAIEMNLNWFGANKIKIGDKIKIINEV